VSERSTGKRVLMHTARIAAVALLAAGCSPGGGDKITPPPSAAATTAPETTGPITVETFPGKPSAKPTAAKPALPPAWPNMPKINFAKKPGQLIPCFAGDIALAAHTDPVDNIKAKPDKNTGNLTGTHAPSATLVAKMHAATVKVEYNIAGTGMHIDGTGTIVDGEIITAAHVVNGKKLSAITIIDSTNNITAVDGGCYIYQRNGQKAPLNAGSLGPQTDIIDDVAVLHPTEKLHNGLQFGNTPLRGQAVYFAGYPSPQQANPEEFVPGVQAAYRDESFSATAILGGKKTDIVKPGDSGGPLVNTDGEFAGVNNAASYGDTAVMGSNLNVFSDKPLQVATYTETFIAGAAVAAHQAQTKAE
jgi:hypothetical protein